ncbi:MAG: hypothetical protein Q9195_000918 [Heterodermia aff. obscurata]
MSENPSQPSALVQVGKPINLVPVGLKEAALDSPTFRSSFTHFLEQLELLERWLENYVRSISKLVNEVGTLEALVNVFFSQSAVPLNISEAVIDHDYTLLAMKRYGEGAKEYWITTIASLKKMDANIVEPIRSFLQNESRSFRDTRRYFEQTQKNFDNLQTRYSAQTRSKEASSLREDAFQLHEARKAYLKASMDFSVAAPQLRMALDKMLVKVFSDQWRDMRARDNIHGSSGKWGTEIERVRGWSYEMELGEKGFRRDLLNARKQIEENTEIAMRPSRELEDYSSTSTAVFPLVTGSPGTRAEKQGWLNLRTVTGKPSRTVWVRRWFFVKNGIFGFLVQGSRSGGVEESERIGVLLCSVRPAVNEERRFCFEVKTKDRTLIVQAETQPELSQWVKAFEIAKQKALEDPASTNSPDLDGPRGQDAAFAITPPSAPELAASGADSGQPQDEGSVSGLDRISTLPLPGGDMNLASRNSFDVTSSKRQTAEGESGRDHASRIIQKLDLHRKSTSGAQVTGGSLMPSSPAGGIASLISASHNVMPIGPGVPPPTPDTPTVRTLAGPNIRELPTSSLAPSTLVNPPTPTNLSTTAIILAGERGIGMGRIDATGGMPSGIMANVWGSSNWGFVNRLERGELKSPVDTRPPVSATPSPRASPRVRPSASPPKRIFSENNGTPKSLATDASVTSGTSQAHRKTISLDSDTQKLGIATQEYPNYYPLQLKTQDAQFRLLFPNVSRDEKVVLVFRATWNLNDQQEFPGRVYVTAREVYFYSHYLGLVLISGVGLSSILEVTSAPGRDCDFLFLHLKDNSTRNGFTRITIKTFLEPLKLLQKRLDFLVRNANTEEPLDLESIMKALIKFEQDDLAKNPDMRGWEGASRDMDYDEDSAHRRSASQRNHRDLRAAVLVDRSLYRNIDEGRDVTKFKLPKQPVIYAPAGMDQAAVERGFDISPKALFHILFGDKSAVWQLLHHERQAQHIKQTPWVQPEQGHLRREFEYQIQYSSTFGRSRQATITDYQIIDVYNDHLCYVVTDRKTAWHLPSNQDFLILSKIVITHVAKSKCKLAIFTKVDWVRRRSILQSLITNRALRDLQLDALDLADVVAEQVRKIGAQSRTKKAVQIFGAIGQQTEVSEFASSDTPSSVRVRRSMKRITMVGLVVESVGSMLERAVTSLLQWMLAVLKWIWKTFDANSILLGILALSVCTNIFFSSWNTSQWWRERSAGKFMARLGVGPDPIMGRALYIHDLDIAANYMEDPSLDPAGKDSKCRQTFESITSLPADFASSSSNKPRSIDTQSSRRLRRTRQTLGTYRHDLLVAMRVVNSIEREVVQAEYEDWLLGENRKCNLLQEAIAENRTEYTAAQLDGIRDWQRGGYCESCGVEQARVLDVARE